VAADPPFRFSDEALLERVVARDVRAFETLYRKHHGRLVGLVTRLTRRAELGDEVANEAMLVLWQRAPDFRGASRVSTWLCGIAYRLALKRLARDSRRPETVEIAEDHGVDTRSPEHAYAEVQSHDRLRRAIAALPPAQRAVVDLTFAEGCSYPEIAELLDLPLGTVKTRMFHARTRLRHALETDRPKDNNEYAP